MKRLPQLRFVLEIFTVTAAFSPAAAHAQVDQNALSQQRLADGAQERRKAANLAQVDQSALAQQVLGESARERAIAVTVAEGLGPENIRPQLRAALITALEREGRVHVERAQAARRGETLPELEAPELIALVAGAVAGLHDAASIPALASFGLGTGGPPIETLAAFGDQAAPAVLAVVMSPNSLHDTVDSGLITLRFMVEGEGDQPLGIGTVDQIRSAAEKHLATGKGSKITTLWRAIDLAVVLNDSKLRGTIKTIASDWNAVLALGVDDPALVEQTQRRAADRLSGVPALPKRIGIR